MRGRGMGDGFSNLFNFGSSGGGSSAGNYSFDFGGGSYNSGLNFNAPAITFDDTISTYTPGSLNNFTPSLSYNDLPYQQPGGGSSGGDFNFTQFFHDLTGAAQGIVPLFTQHGARPGSYQAVQQQAQQQQQQDDQGGGTDAAPAAGGMDTQTMLYVGIGAAVILGGLYIVSSKRAKR